MQFVVSRLGFFAAARTGFFVSSRDQKPLLFWSRNVSKHFLRPEKQMMRPQAYGCRALFIKWHLMTGAHRQAFVWPSRPGNGGLKAAIIGARTVNVCVLSVLLVQIVSNRFFVDSICYHSVPFGSI